MAIAKIITINGEKGVVIPASILEQLEIDDAVYIDNDDKQIIIKKKPNVSKIDQRFANFDVNRYHEKLEAESREFHWGQDMGKEIF